MEKDIVILAMTRMFTGICIAGIEPETGQWIRPVRPEVSDRLEHSLQLTDLVVKGIPQVKYLDISRFFLGEARPDPPHIEDRLLDRRFKPKLIKEFTAEERLDFLSTYQDRSSIDRLLNKESSLGLIKPDDFTIRFGPNKAGADISVRIDFSLGQAFYQDKPCPDLKIRALGRKLLQHFKCSHYQLDREDFLKKGYDHIFFALGLTRLYQGEHWLMVIGLHSAPEYKAEIDFTNL
ncbi:MAG: hypothetical protein QME81_00120 [bacterium]|nr:hypothetical protein [bacterium]